MKLKIGDSVKTKDGRKFKVVSKDNGYFVLKDSKGKMAKVKDAKYSEEAMEVATKLGKFAFELSAMFDRDYKNCFHDLDQKYHLFEDEEIKKMYYKIQNYYNKTHRWVWAIKDLVAQKIDGVHPTTDSTNSLKDSTYSPEEMLMYLAHISWDFSVPFAEVVDNIIKMLKDLDNTQEYLDMYGPKEEMNEAILAFIKENPDFDWSSVQI